MARGRKGKGGGLLRTAERLGVNRGLFGGSKGWLYVGSGLWTLRTVRRMAGRKTEILVSEEIGPGDRLVIANGRATIDHGPAELATPSTGRRRSRRRRG